MSAPHRRTIYTASLEAHIDRLHEQLASYALARVKQQVAWPIHMGGLRFLDSTNGHTGLAHGLN